MWNHNNHYHRLLLRAVPKGCLRALDIGCGRGDLASKLSSVCQEVDAIDPDEAAIDQVRRQYAGQPNITFSCIRFDEADIPPDRYDFIVLLASLHHMDLQPTLEHLRRILRPSGTLAIVGTYKEKGIADYLWAALAAPLNVLFRLMKNGSLMTDDQGMIVKDANETLKDIRRVTAEVLPGRRIRHLLFWRYLLLWTRE
jgi:2-polyprenyl-3-methyl-5-hydroxy-6-metoxy-1,4-benzoquinol methylase